MTMKDKLQSFNYIPGELSCIAYQCKSCCFFFVFSIETQINKFLILSWW